MRQRLFWKILLGFWLTFAVATEAVFIIYVVLFPIPSDATRALSRMELAVAASAIHEGGKPFLDKVMADWPDDVRGDLTVEPWGPGSRVLTDLNQGAVSTRVVAPGGQAYLATYTVRRFAYWGHPPFDLPRQIMMLAVIGGLGFSTILAWYLTRPITRLRQGFEQLSAGDFSTRLTPGMGRRKDELADLAQDFDSMAGRLEELVAARDKLLSDVSHELRSPLARLQLAIGLARQDPLRLEASLDRIGVEAQRLDGLVGELLTLSKQESRAAGPEEYFDLAGVVAGVVDDARFEASDKGVQIALETGADGEEMLVAGSGRLISRAVENVVRNALRFSRDGQTVQVSARRDDGHFRVLVEDDGPGVPPDVLPGLFRAFVKGVPDGQGYGLGLAIAQRAVVANGGTITARNREEGGLSIAITLPAVQTA
jgi:two-component system OmpR family sensor kinase